MRRVKRLGLFAAILGIGVSGITVSMVAADSGTRLITGCLSPVVGHLRIIDPEAGDTCKTNETPLTWNQAGRPGSDGNTVLNGVGLPAGLLGANGDFYIDTAANEVYGPKADGAWPSIGVSLVGPPGPQGPVGPQGPAGPAGPAGVTSLESLEGTSCRVGQPEAGVVRVTFGSTGIAAITCVPSKHFALTVTKDGTGSGTVTGSSFGTPVIDCGEICTSQVPVNRQVQLTALAAKDARFGGWSGACSGASGNTCLVAMDQAMTVTATFVATRTLRVFPQYGTVTYPCSPGPTCSYRTTGGVQFSDGTRTGWCRVAAYTGLHGDCEPTFDLGTTVTLTKTGGTWGGECAVATDSCVLVMDAHKSVFVQF